MPNALVTHNLPILSLPGTGALGSLDAYISGVHQIPVLSVEDEQRLARRLRDDNDLQPRRSWSCRTCASSSTSPAVTAATACRWAT